MSVVRKSLLSVLGLVCMVSLWANQVVYFWSGAVTDTSAKVNAVLQSPAEKVRLVIATDKVFSQPMYSGYETASADHGNTVSLHVTGLQPNTMYYYCFEIEGMKDRDDDRSGSFRTFVNGPFTYTFVAGSCNFFPNNRVYDKMGAIDPLFLLMPGDLHYSNPSSSDIEPHRIAYEEKVLQQPREAKFLHKTPIAYIWDDHDFCGDNNDGTSGCGQAAFNAYTEYVPYYPLGGPAGSNAIYQAFTVGRIRFIATDLRSDRREGDIMSIDQKNWFKKEIITARNNDQMICWVSSVSYSGTKSDNWGGYPSTRTELANFFRDSNVTNLFIISGDAHMLAIDNGTHADFSEGKNNPSLYPILQSAALNNVGSDKGGEYSEGGTFPNPAFSSQWSKIDVIDNGTNDIAIRFTCYRMDLFTKAVRVMTKFEFCRSFNDEINFLSPANKSLVAKITEPGKVDIAIDYKGKADLRIIDYTGNQILNQSGIPIDKFLQVDVTNLATDGIYYVILDTDKGSYITKLQ